MLDLEYNVYADKDGTDSCYGLDSSEMVLWIMDFIRAYRFATKRSPLIYTTADWWRTCTGDSAAFAKSTSLVLARYDDTIGEIPGGWPHITIWQYNDEFPFGGCSDVFNGNFKQLRTLASGIEYF